MASETDKLVAFLTTEIEKKKNGKDKTVKMSADGTVQEVVDRAEQGRRIQVPDGMTKLDAAHELVRQHEEEQKKSNYTREFKGYFWQDVLVAIRRATEHHFGWIDGRNTPPGMFTPSQPPRKLEVTVGFKKDGRAITESAFLGLFNIAPFGDAQAATFAHGPFKCGLQVTARKMYEAQVNEYFAVIEKFLKEKSIFRGRAVMVKTVYDEMLGEVMDFTMERVIENPNIVLNEGTERIYDVLLLSDLDDNGKRITLFTGSYGNGKTETALRLAVAAMEKGYTFFYVKEPKQLKDVLLATKVYLPAFVFMEDIDQVASGSERSQEINDILNTLDGAELKGHNIKVLFTTNHENRLNEALRRPGRIDNVVTFADPDKTAKAEIVRRLLGDLNGFDALDIELCVAKLPDVQGAFIAEICKRARKYSISKGEITTPIFLAASESMEDHIKLMSAPVQSNKKPLAEAVETLGKALRGDSEDEEEDDHF
jgi:hypothetical protein